MTEFLTEPPVGIVLKSLLDSEPVEDGIVHPAEAVLEETFRSQPEAAQVWTLELLSTRQSTPSFQADLLRLLGRMRPLTEDWRRRIVGLGLSSPHLEVRDAAVQAAEIWGDRGLSTVLAEHEEPSPWLAEYISRVVRDLTSS